MNPIGEDGTHLSLPVITNSYVRGPTGPSSFISTTPFIIVATSTDPAGESTVITALIGPQTDDKADDKAATNSSDVIVRPANELIISHNVICFGGKSIFSLHE